MQVPARIPASNGLWVFRKNANEMTTKMLGSIKPPDFGMPDDYG